MDLNMPVFTTAGRTITLADIAVAAAGLALVLLLLAVILSFRAQAGRRREREEAARRTSDLEYRLAELSGALQGFAAQSQSHHIHLQRVIDERLDMVSTKVGHGLSEQAAKPQARISVVRMCAGASFSRVATMRAVPRVVCDRCR